jgi:hypothetical protein
LHKLEFTIFSFWGVNQHVKPKWRILTQEFGEIFVYNLAIKKIISWMDVKLQHCGAGSTLSKKAPCIYHCDADGGGLQEKPTSQDLKKNSN